MGSRDGSKKVALRFLANEAGEPLGLLLPDPSSPHCSTKFVGVLHAKQPGAEGSSCTSELDWEGGSSPLFARGTPQNVACSLLHRQHIAAH